MLEKLIMAFSISFSTFPSRGDTMANIVVGDEIDVVQICEPTRLGTFFSVTLTSTCVSLALYHTD